MKALILLLLFVALAVAQWHGPPRGKRSPQGWDPKHPSQWHGPPRGKRFAPEPQGWHGPPRGKRFAPEPQGWHGPPRG